MKISNEKLKQIIKEELDAVMNESVLTTLALGGLAMTALTKWMNKTSSGPQGDWHQIWQEELESNLIEAGFEPEPRIDWKVWRNQGAFDFNLSKPGAGEARIRMYKEYRADNKEEAQLLALGHAMEQFQNKARERQRELSRGRMSRGEESVTIDDPMMERKKRRTKRKR